jgi:hydroxymethylpyrimidine/phosphomethylpyrimidine kinase
MAIPIALTIAGSDSSGGAGIQADLKTFSALGVYGASVITALTAQNTLGVSGVLATPAAFVVAQLEAVLGDLRVGAIKTGMLANAGIVQAVVEALDRLAPHVPLIVDPVMVATSGDRLLEPDAVALVKDVLCARAALITPNLAEAAVLTGRSEARSVEQMADQGALLLGTGCKAVLIKGGHSQNEEASDVLVMKGYVRVLSSPRIATAHTHGTGCTLSAAICAFVARGDALGLAVEQAKAYLQQALVAGCNLNIGSGRGPVDHLFGQR